MRSEMGHLGVKMPKISASAPAAPRPKLGSYGRFSESFLAIFGRFSECHFYAQMRPEMGHLGVKMPKISASAPAAPRPELGSYGRFSESFLAILFLKNQRDTSHTEPSL